ncbi:MAG: VWA domain-containing protein [Alphaproteobacteria bacterium]|nr:VWA domain-containing protein [Alphaproteobacteria bacterium]
MTAARQQTTIDPLRIFIGKRAQGLPVPLVATSFGVVIDGGLAVVTASRIFRNAESSSIEATITFPVPVHASLFALKIRIGERVLGAQAMRKDAARESYEDALDRGRTAVLHEEVLRGVHMLSVGHVAPETEIEVTSSFAVSLTNQGSCATLRIPLTVGDIYGHSPLSDADDLACGGALPDADLTVACRDGSVRLIGGKLEDGRARIAINAPIDLEVTGWTPRDLNGRAADGRAVALRIAPTPGEEVPLDVAILVDHSGSMAEPCTGDREGGTKHHVVVTALERIAKTVGKSDRIDLWEFNYEASYVGSTRPGSESQTDLVTLAQALSSPRYGTEIGGALDRVLTASSVRDLLLITDGKSHALDVQALARRGHRISVVLVGEDSLEANVGHLAALSGGEIFVATGSDLIAAIESAMRALRILSLPPLITGSPLERVVLRRGGMTLTARWQEGDTINGDALFQRAVGALAASLALPAMADDRAAALAEAEGLVTHLTSLILIDEETVQESIPATRKIALPTPRTLGLIETALVCDLAPGPSSLSSLEVPHEETAGAKPAQNPNLEFVAGAPEPLFLYKAEPPFSLFDHVRYIALRIRWQDIAASLQNGDLSALADSDASAIRALAGRQRIIDIAAKYALDPLLLVIALMAFWNAESSDAAAGTCRVILGGVPIKKCLAAIEAVGVIDRLEAINALDAAD